MSTPWFGCYLPQLRMHFTTILDRTLAAEATGFNSLWLMDHIAAPGAPDKDTFEGWTLAAALAARTATIRIGHLVNADPFRHPVLLAKMAATVDVISDGRLELGLGWGSVEAELESYGFGQFSKVERAERMRESIEILDLMFSGEAFSFNGKYFTLDRAIGRPVPVQLPRPPLHIGGAGPHLTMPIVRDHADWWNCPSYAINRLDDLRPLAGDARISVQHPVALVLDEASRDETLTTAQRRFGGWGGLVAGTANEVADALASEAASGVEGFIIQFTDFAEPDTLQHFMEAVAPVIRTA